MPLKQIHPLYTIWVGMINRCHVPHSKSYASYGERGIRVCESWRIDFWAFVSDMPPRPSPKHSIERIDNNKNYELGNCRWATFREQANNRRNNRLLTANGRTQTIAAWANETGINHQTILNRLLRGWDDQRAVSKAARKKAANNTILPPGGFRYCQKLGIDPGTVASRIRRGLSFEQALRDDPL